MIFPKKVIVGLKLHETFEVVTESGKEKLSTMYIVLTYQETTHIDIGGYYIQARMHTS